MTTTFGIEEEFLVVDRSTGDLATRAPEVLSRRASTIEEFVTSELNHCQVETNSAVCTTLEEATTEVLRLRAGLKLAASGTGTSVVALATHPWSAWNDQQVNTDTAHYRELLSTYQQVARQQVICGCHIHVQVDDPDRRITAMNRVRPWLPVLLALSANSPWWQGSDTGYASYRTMVWRAWPTATFPPTLGDEEDYQKLARSLLRLEAIDTPGALYWHVRPSAKLPTLEFRVCDVCLRAEDAVTLAGVARALTTTALEPTFADPIPPNAVLDSALWRAARYGLDGTLFDPTTGELGPAAAVVHHLMARIDSALRESGDRERVSDGIAAMLGRNNGAHFQRKLLQEGITPPELMATVAVG